MNQPHPSDATTHEKTAPILPPRLPQEACLGKTTTNSPFSVSGELTQVLNLGMIAEYLNVDLKFDPKKKRFVGNDEANQLLAGAPPRAEWAHYYTLA